MIYCLGCSYCLEGLTELCCPECGRGFDPNDSNTFASQLPRRRWIRPGITFLLLSLLGAAFIMFPIEGPVPRSGRPDGDTVFLGFLIEVFVLILAVSTAFFKQYRSSLCLWLAILISLVSIAAFFLIAIGNVARTMM